MRVMSCNVRTSAARDGENAWPLRRRLCCDIIRSREPDVICCQEARQDQSADLIESFSEYDSFGLPDGPLSRHSMNLILYRQATFRLIGAGGFWLSETPHVPGSSSWGSACVRLANWVRLEAPDTGKGFTVINTHLDHVSQDARENQAALINEWAAAYPADYPLILTGDMNANPENSAIASLRASGWRDAYEAVHGIVEPTYTCHGFRGENLQLNEEPWARRIDWIFSRGNLDVSDSEIVRDSIDGRYPSDHFFLTAECRLV